MKSGIYKILNTVNGKAYIGSSENIKRRLKDHKGYLQNNKHPSTHLQNAYNKYGVASFEYSILEYCEVEILEVREDYWLSLVPNDKKYKQRAVSKSNRGMRWSEESKCKLKGRKVWNKGLKGIAPSYSIPKGERISVGTEFKKGQTAWNKGTKGIIKANKGSFKPKSFAVVSPENVIFKGENLYRFSKEHGLEYTGMQKLVFYNTKTEYKGWKIAV